MSLLKKTVSGTFWATGSSLIRTLIQILRLSILTRFLDKTDFGLVAIAVLVLGFTNIFTDLGISISLYSRNEISRNEYSSLYWVSFLLSLVLYAVLCVLSPSITAFYHLPILKNLIPVMGLDLIITTAGRQFRIFREKELRFKSLAIIDISSLILSLFVALWLAMNNGGVYSLIFSTLSASAVSTILLIITGLKKHPLSFYINVKEGRSFYRIGIYQTGSQILDYFSSQLDILIIGKIMSASDLGVYNLIKQLVLKVYGVLNQIITTVSVPVLASFQENLPKLKEKYMLMLKVISFINFGIYGLMFLVSQDLLIIVYGTAYQSSFRILQILCIWGSFSSVMSAASTLIIIKGRTDLGFKWTILRLLIIPLFIFGGAYFGLLGIVIGQTAFSIIFFPVYWKLIINKILNQISLKEFFRNFLSYLVTGLLCITVFSTLDILFLEKYFSFLINFLILCMCFALSYFFINKKSFFTFLNILNIHK